MNDQYKVCPNCQTPASLGAPSCLTCGHTYRTTFAAAPPPVQQTQAFQSSPYLPQRAYAPNYDTVLAECARQYHMFTWFWILAIMIAPVLLGFFWIFFLQQAQSRIRTEVARLGIDAEAWEQTQLPRRRRIMINFFAIFFGLIIIGAVASQRDEAPKYAPREFRHEEVPPKGF